MIDFDRLLNIPAMTFFAQPVIVLPAEGPSFQTRGILDRRDVAAGFDGNGVEVGATQTTFYIRPLEMLDRNPILVGDVLSIVEQPHAPQAPVLYDVADTAPDPTGGLLLILTKHDE